MPLKRERMSRDQLARSVNQKKIQKQKFLNVSMGKRIQRFGTAMRQGNLTNRQKAFLKKKVQIERLQSKKKIPKKITVDKYFDKVFVLNMSRQLDKWHNMVNRMKRVGITNYERFNAIDGSAEPHISQWTKYSKKPYNKFDRKYKRKAIRSPGVWGILKSMKRMFLVAKKRGYKNFLVLQDDAMFHHNFINMFDRKMRKIPPWRMLFLGVTQYTYSRDMLNAKEFYYPIGMADGAYAVAFNESIYDFIIRQINLFVMPFDSGPLMTVQKTFPRECIVVSPLIIIADVRSSSCRSGRDQSKFSKQVRWDYQKFIEYKTVPENSLVTVVMVVENSSAYVTDAIYSIVHQTYKNIELIIFDNASEDDTVLLIGAIKNKLKRGPSITLYTSDKKLNSSIYKNVGMMIGSGRAITFQDPDCKSISTRIDKQMVLLRRNNGIVTVGYREDKEGNIESSLKSMMISKKVIDEIGYLENSVDGYEYEYYQKAKNCKLPSSDIKEIFYIPYAALSENRDDSDHLSIERKDQIDKYHDWLNKRKGPKYRSFPPSDDKTIYREVAEIVKH